ncbi:fibrous sheath CABYR-binding protein-like [Musca domestica]|uniref:Fibrous sheath CABYR-binding protein-like n=1 Tax=Musca domestica TaxID=7370 RepID=A0ABM3VD37_MUSDO|nr:fibrous sheath CABYR-binding protein-like [Musca domestica]
MLKKFLIVFLAVAIGCAAADPIRQKPLRRRVSARQEVAPPTPAPTGYPPAGVTPEVPFELPTETQTPDEVYGPPEAPEPQPDEVYGPPEATEPQPDEVYGPPEAVEPQQQPEEPQPDAVYGPPETETTSTTEVAEEFPQETEEVVPVEEELEEEAEAEAEDVDEVEEEVLLSDDGSVIAVSTTFDQKPARLVYQRFPQRRQPPTSVPARLRVAKIRQPSAIVYTTRYQRL